ncbi:MAG: hypothetical protein K1X71_14825 [Pirellulales bacterium]|nr:hypothetical protein [Pirellulales bacterium]
MPASTAKARDIGDKPAGLAAHPSTGLEPSNRLPGRLTRHLRAADIASLIACCVCFCLWTVATTRTISLPQIGILASLTICALVWGRVIFALAGLNQFVPRLFSHALLVGMLWLGLTLAALRMLTPMNLANLYTAQAIVGLTLYATLARRIGDWNPGRRAEWPSFIVTLTSLLASTFWLRHLCPVAETAEDWTVYRPFVEYFFHATHVTPLLLPGSAVGNGSIQFAGVPLAFYHYASLAYPALLADLGGSGAYEALTSLWYPLGTFLAGLAAYFLGSQWFGPRAGFWCAIALRLLPDPSIWGFGIDLYSFNIFLEAMPALAYAVSAAAVALGILAIAIRRRRILLVWFSLAIAASTIFFKANVFVAVVPLGCLLFLLAWRRFGTQRMWPSAVALGALGLAGIVGLTQLRSAPSVGIDPELGSAFADHILAAQTPADSAAQRLRPYVMQSGASGALARLGFVILVTFQGGLLLLAAAMIALAIDRRRAWLLLALLIALGLYLASAILLPPNANGDPFELQHRAFAWVYLLAVVWTTGVLVTFWNRWTPPKWRTGYLAALPLLAVPLVLGTQTFIDRSSPVKTGLADCARYIHRESNPLDVVWDSRNDPTLLTAALTERRAMVSISPTDTYPGSGALSAIHRERGALTEAFKQASASENVRRIAKESGARWFLLHAGDDVQWPSELLSRPMFESRGFRVYDLTQM